MKCLELLLSTGVQNITGLWVQKGSGIQVFNFSNGTLLNLDPVHLKFVHCKHVFDIAGLNIASDSKDYFLPVQIKKFPSLKSIDVKNNFNLLLRHEIFTQSPFGDANVQCYSRAFKHRGKVLSKSKDFT